MLKFIIELLFIGAGIAGSVASFLLSNKIINDRKGIIFGYFSGHAIADFFLALFEDVASELKFTRIFQKNIILSTLIIFFT